MSNQIAIFLSDTGEVEYLIPTPECLITYTIKQIAEKDVPAGKKFKIINVEDLPIDYPKEAWVVDEAELTDGVGNESYQFEV